MKHLLALVSSATLLVVVSSAAAKNPLKNWSYCKKSDPKLNQCLVNALNSIRPDIINGNSFFFFFPIDPLHLTKLSVKSLGGSSSVNIDLTLSEFDIIGMGSWKVKTIDADWDKGIIKGDIHLEDNVVALGDYTTKGKILLLPITGEGKFNFTYEDMSVKIEIKGKPIEKKGKKYFHVDDMAVILNPKRLYIRQDNLFNGNKALGDNMNEVMNENWQELNRETQPAVSQALGTAFKEIANRVFAKIPYDMLVPQ